MSLDVRLPTAASVGLAPHHGRGPAPGRTPGGLSDSDAAGRQAGGHAHHTSSSQSLRRTCPGGNARAIRSRGRPRSLTPAEADHRGLDRSDRHVHGARIILRNPHALQLRLRGRRVGSSAVAASCGWASKTWPPRGCSCARARPDADRRRAGRAQSGRPARLPSVKSMQDTADHARPFPGRRSHRARGGDSAR